jgi:hypothetical protein
MLAGRAEPGRDQDGTELVTVQGSRMGLVIRPRPADVRRGRVLEELFFDRVLAEPGDGAQPPPGDGGAGTAGRLQLPGEGLDVRAADREQRQRPCPAPAAELAQVQGAGVAGQAAVPGQEPGEREPLGVGEARGPRAYRPLPASAYGDIFNEALSYGVRASASSYPGLGQGVRTTAPVVWPSATWASAWAASARR